jgi:hypothetical protein
LTADEAVIKLFKDNNYEKGKNFIVLHLRVAHSPYQDKYEHKKEEFEKFNGNSFDHYDNAILFFDYLMDSIIQYTKLQSGNKPYYIFFTSDHGEGDRMDGLGHGMLKFGVAEVPFFVVSNKKLELPKLTNHYEIGKMILNAIGYNLKNRNEKRNIGYIHGSSNGNYQFIKYRIKNGEAKDIKFMNVKDLIE